MNNDDSMLPSIVQGDPYRICVECHQPFFGEGFTASSLWPYRHYGPQAITPWLDPSGASSARAFFPCLTR
jgi:hypothetical protein